ncbi:MAG: phosphatidylglycerophosphatase A [Elusimicrobia bacterium]|nr:phosphatidylglycerophosphatase A [Elusimicrobiota bacterium]MDE2425569.1 phosphatidylglycerophosphatase A [Elusimicrobiota bacterium]
MRRAGRAAILFFATGGYLSYIPSTLTGPDRKWTGAGLIGSLEGLALLPLLPKGGMPLWAALAVATALACWLCGEAEKILGRHDDPRIVLDEVVGMWFSAALLPRRLLPLLAALALFRLLDSVKLPPYGWLERLPGGAGVVFDDVGAGLFANLGVRLLLRGALL